MNEKGILMNLFVVNIILILFMNSGLPADDGLVHGEIRSCDEGM